MRAYLLTLAASAACAVILTSLASFIADPYHIVHPLSGMVRMQPNDRAAKTAFLARRCNQFDSYIFGNSRSQIIEGSQFAPAAARYYNLSAPGEDIEQSLELLEFLLKADCPVSALLIGESVDVLGHPGPHWLTQMRHPLISGDNSLVFYSRYFLGPQGAMAYLRSRLSRASHPMFYHPDGHVDYLWEMQSDADYATAFCQIGRLSAQEKRELFERLPQYRKLGMLAAQHHFKVIVWLTPLSEPRSVVLDDPDVARYISELHQIAGLRVFDSDRDSSLLSDFRQWHDCSHFHRSVFDRLVAPAAAKWLRE